MTAGWRLSGDALVAHGERAALASREGAVSYAELALRAAGVWRQLRRADVMPGHRVAIVSAGRGHDEAVGLAGILTSGAVAVPMDATAPPQRLAAIARARDCSAVVLDEAAERLVADMCEALDITRIVLDASGQVVGATPGAKARPARADHDLACILHTSGSTGTPKAVPMTWAGLDAFTRWAVQLIGLSPNDRVLRVAELVFDLAWFDHVATWRTGATLVSPSRREMAAGRALADAIGNLAPTVIYGVPSLFIKVSAALGAGARLSPCPRAVFFAGEVFPPRELLDFAARVPEAALYNLYGPTETNVCTFHTVDRGALDGVRETPIGVACPYARCTLVDEGSGSVLEGPGMGELVVEGPTTVGGGPYPTRDRVERGPDGLFYFRGRLDRMVKVRGYRVEPGEVETALGAHPAVRQAAVVVHADPRLGATLRAFVTLRDPMTAPAALRLYLAERLPAYMVPDKAVVLDELPLTATGKIDYGRLA